MADASVQRILVVEPMSSGQSLLRAARELGIETVAASFDVGDRRLSPALRELVDTLVVLDTNDEAALTAAVLAQHAERPLAGIMPGFEFYVDSVARLAARLGLPGLPLHAVEGLRDKAVMRAKIAAAGLRVPRHAAVSSSAELAAAADLVGFPLVIKPTRSAGSVHVTRADNLAALRAAYEYLLTDPRTDLGRGLDGHALLEEYLDGPEVSVEGYLDDGEVVTASVTQKVLGPEPFFVEVGHLVQAELAPDTRTAIEAYVRAVCRTLGLTLGPFHCELRLPAGEPVLIELGARLAGDHIVDLVEIAAGISLPRVMLATYTGLDLASVAGPVAPRAKAAGIRFFTAPHLTRLTAVPDLAALRAAPDVVEAELYLGPGDEVPPPEDFRSRIGHVIFVADSPGEALVRWHSLAEGVRFA